MIRLKARAPTRRGVRRARALALPTLWGGAAILYKLLCPLAQRNGFGARIVTCAVFFAVGTGLMIHGRRALLRELRQARRVAGAAQSVLLRPPPARLDGLLVAAGQLSADRGAAIGGDLYEAIATEHGVRVVMGDVRGHGLAALATVAAVLGSFREAVHDEPELGCVLRRLDRALDRHLRERARAEHPSAGREPATPVAEEFVTVLVLEIRPDGELRALSCGHPWPYRLGDHGVEPLTRAEPLPPLGPFPLPREVEPAFRGRLLPGESLALYTDGAEDARDAQGRFFPLPDILTKAARDDPVCPQTVLRTVLTSLLRHTAGAPTDDIAVLILRNERGGAKRGAPPRSAGNRAADPPHPAADNASLAAPP
ncbi:PP2C family protein-serine/threonine phosphatase [Streptomyces sp. NPDC001508]|uniref:PP2C family protein-serine/threonine phosphatase n=1 Tax=Streptomyces sp. NPDC001508 TaxID=3154656 RepID=UPI00331E47DA